MEFIRKEEGKLFEGHTKSIACFLLTSDNKFLISGSDDMRIKIWSLILD